ncbi:MAG: hypothetical protein QOJ40_2944 [Verrucomicrobiota bacterium]
MRQIGKLIGKGLMSQVYAWGEDRAIKLFQSWVPPAKADQEFRVTRAIHAVGLPVPAAYELLEVNGRKGIVLDRVDGISMYDSVVAKPWLLFSAARQLAELHAKLHARKAPAELTSQRERIATRIDEAGRSSDDEKQIARRRLSELPDGDTVCHGDFHPANILLTKNGPVVIDWMSGTRGHPLGDVAQTSLLFDIAKLPDDAPAHIRILMKVSRQLLHKNYLKRYLQLSTGTMQEIKAWRPALKAAVGAWPANRAR